MVRVSTSVPLDHGRRLAYRNGHGRGNPVMGLIGLVVIYALIRGAIG